MQTQNGALQDKLNSMIRVAAWSPLDRLLYWFAGRESVKEERQALTNIANGMIPGRRTSPSLYDAQLTATKPCQCTENWLLAR